MAFFSIIVPIYNVEDYMRECIDSILGQSYTDFELILVNDGSTDSSGEICDEYLMKDKRIKVIQQNNGGASKARNSGLQKAKGKYIYFIDSDDYLGHNDVFQRIYNIILEDDNIDIVKLKQIAFKDRTEEFYKVYKYNDITNINGLNGVDAMIKLCETGQMVVSVYSYFIRREILVDNRIYFIEGTYSEDINWVPRVFMIANKVSTLDEYAYCRRQNRPGQVTYQANLKRDLDCVKIVDDWFKQKESLSIITANNNSDYFWNYLANIYVGLITNQYIYKGHQAKQRLDELSKYAYIIMYLKSGKFKKFNILYKLFGFKVYTLVVSQIKRTYRFYNR